MAENENDSKYWRGRAAEARVMVKQMRDAEERSIMLEIAEAYDRIAERVARNEGSASKSD